MLQCMKHAGRGKCTEYCEDGSALHCAYDGEQMFDSVREGSLHVRRADRAMSSNHSVASQPQRGLDTVRGLNSCPLSDV